MASSFTHMKLLDVKDSAAEFGYSDAQEARFARGDLEAEQTGVSHLRLKPAQRCPSATSTRRPRRSMWC